MNFTEHKSNSISSLQKVCLRQNIPFVSYRLPLETEIVTLIQQHSFPEKLFSYNNLDEKEGFVIAPFIDSKENYGYLLKPDSLFYSNEIDASFIRNIAENNRFVELNKVQQYNSTTTFDEFVSNVKKAVDSIKMADLQKVVMSKIRVEQLPNNFAPEIFYHQLCQKYPHAFVYMLQLPEVGCWIGASPEQLLTVGNDLVKTVSLAGTQLATNEAVESYKWTTKEIDEQEIVTNFVEQTLRSLNICHYNKVGPINYQAANLIHLMTSFEFRQEEIKNNFTELLCKLHPTPSVGGLPIKKAQDFIVQNEKHNRAYYAGFLGPINISKKSAIFVNLRCLQLIENEFVLYSGAGITATSVAEKEWEETENKMMTLLNVIMAPNT